MHLWIKFTKNAQVRFISHRDILKVMIRAMRRVNLPLVYSQGFNPHPKVSFAAPLALGTTSEAEYMELELAEDMTLDEVKQRLCQTLPRGFDILAINEVLTKEPKLMAWIERSLYQMTLKPLKPYTTMEIVHKLKVFMENDKVLLVKKTKKSEKTINVRPWIHTLDAIDVGETIVINTCLQTGQKGNFKVEEFLQVVTNYMDIKYCANPLCHRLELFGPIGNQYGTPMEKLAVKFKE